MVLRLSLSYKLRITSQVAYELWHFPEEVNPHNRLGLSSHPQPALKQLIGLKFNTNEFNQLEMRLASNCPRNNLSIRAGEAVKVVPHF